MTLRPSLTAPLFAALALLSAAGVAGAPVNAYTASALPSVVKPSSTVSFTVRLVNDPTSPERAQRARIGIPTGFGVQAATVTATASATGSCVATAWVADGTLIADGRINLRRPGGGQTNELCPGATLTVTFTATAPSTDATGAWATELLRGDVPFALSGTQPSIRVDGTAPTTTIQSAPPDPSTVSSASFTFAAGEAGVTFACRLDGAPFDACSSPKSYPSLTDGGHEFEVRATDPAGNTGPIARHAWSIATAQPLTSIDSTPANPSASRSATFAFSTGPAGATFECLLDAGQFAPCTSPHTYNDLADGSHRFLVRATDTDGHVGSPAGHAWRVDTVPPTVTIGSKPADLTNSPTAAFAFSANETGATFECALDGGAFQACTSPKTYSSLGHGAHMFAVRGVDDAGNQGPAGTHAWTVDLVAPETTIESGPPALSGSVSASFAFSSSEAGSSFQCRLDSGAFSPCGSPAAHSALTQGAHVFEVRAIDAAGNVDASVASRSWQVDTISPETTLGGAPSSPTNTTNPSFSFSASESGSTFECKLDGAAFAACTSPQAYTGLGEGSRRFEVRATDPTGNVDPTPAVHVWTIDVTSALTSIGSKPSDPSNSPNPSFSFSADEAGSAFQCKLDGAAFAPCTSPHTYSGVSSTSHTFQVRAVDPAGNVGAPASYSWTIDTTAPQTTIDSGPTGAINATSASFVLSASEADSTFECRLDAAFAPCESPTEYSQLTDGTRTFQVRATDAAGNQDLTPASRTWTVDTAAPTVTLASPLDGSATNDPTPTISGAAGNAPGDVVTVTARVYAGRTTTTTPLQTLTVTRNGGSWSTTPTVLVEGAYTVAAVQLDTAGNVGHSSVSTFVVDLSGPSAAIVDRPPAVSASSTASFEFSSSDPNATFQCRLDSSVEAAFVACSSPKAYSGLADGPHSFSVRAKDALGNTGGIAEDTWTIDTTAPAASITTAPHVVTAGRTATFAFSVDEPGVKVDCRLDAGPFAVCTSPNSYGGLADGAHTFTLRAVDGGGNVGMAFWTWTIDTVAPQTEISGGPPPASSTGAAGFTFASNEPGSVFECSLDGAAFTPCASPASFADLADGPHSFRARAHDPAGNVDPSPAAYDWTISRPPPPPAADRTPPAEVSNARVKLGNRTVELAWALPADPDFDHVSVSRTETGKSTPAAVYTGKGTAFTDRSVVIGRRYTYRITTHDGAGNGSTGLTLRATATAFLFAPVKGSRVTSPPVLRWVPVRGATYFNVQLWFLSGGGQKKAVKGVKVLSAWPSATKLKLQQRWTFEGRSLRLLPGRYQWYVFPGFGKRSAERYGSLLGDSTFTVAAVKG